MGERTADGHSHRLMALMLHRTVLKYLRRL